jgi:hypothetical protein
MKTMIMWGWVRFGLHLYVLQLLEVKKYISVNDDYYHKDVNWSVKKVLPTKCQYHEKYPSSPWSPQCLLLWQN